MYSATQRTQGGHHRADHLRFAFGMLPDRDKLLLVAADAVTRNKLPLLLSPHHLHPVCPENLCIPRILTRTDVLT